jgi:hypothetical protein
LEQDENVEANGKMHGVGVSASGFVAKKGQTYRCGTRP